MAMRFDPTINPGHVLTFVALLVAGFGAYGMMDKRVSVLEEAKTAQASVDRRQDTDLAEMKRNNREDFKEINDKLDKILLSMNGQQFTPGRR